jgi:hypothetical protein
VKYIIKGVIVRHVVHFKTDEGYARVFNTHEEARKYLKFIEQRKQIPAMVERKHLKLLKIVRFCSEGSD